jgi:hypothetical protein
MADQDQREHDAKKDAKPVEYAKCRMCRQELPTEGMLDGVCDTCVTGKHYCTECEFCNDPSNPGYAKCLKSPSVDMVSRKSENFYYCCVVRKFEQTGQHCENFKFSEDVLSEVE